MPPQTRKRKTTAKSTSQPPLKKSRAASKAEDANNIIGGMKGDYRVTGGEKSKDFESFTVSGANGKDIPCQIWGDDSTKARPALIFTHGAGGGIENPATRSFAAGYSKESPVVLFQGTMNLKSRVASFRAVLNHQKAQHAGRSFVVGGRSMGARAATMLASEDEDVSKLVLVSYPLASPKGDDRDQILLDLPSSKEVLFVVGSQDSMCDLGKLETVRRKMKAKSSLLVVDGADHGMSIGTGTGVKAKDKSRVVESLRQLSGRHAADWVKNPKEMKVEQISNTDVE